MGCLRQLLGGSLVRLSISSPRAFHALKRLHAKSIF
nr:MAG TPA: hypothetical protein [Caudoviricetes sp.]